MAIRIIVDDRLAVQKLQLIYRELNDSATPIALSKIGDRYIQWLRRRWMSGGNGEWAPLRRQTIYNKRWRRIATNPEAIMRESDTMINSLAKRAFKRSVLVGILYHRKYPFFQPGVLIPRRNALRRKKNQGRPLSKKSVKELAEIHARGGPNLPKRQVIVPPPEGVRRNFVTILKRELDVSLKKFR